MHSWTAYSETLSLLLWTLWSSVGSTTVSRCSLACTKSTCDSSSELSTLQHDWFQCWQRDWARNQCVTVAQLRTASVHSPLLAGYLYQMPELCHLSTLQQWGSRAPGATVSSSRQSPVGHLARRKVQHRPSTPLGLLGADSPYLTENERGRASHAMWDHTVSCHPTQVNFTLPPASRWVLNLCPLEGRTGRLSWLWCFTYPSTSNLMSTLSGVELMFTCILMVSRQAIW